MKFDLMIIFNIILILLFFWMSLYSLANLTKLEKRFYEFDLEGVGFKHYLFYISRLLYFVWIVVGLFSNHYSFFLILFGLILSKFLIFYLSKKFYKFLNVFNPFIVMVILTILLFLNIKSF